MNRLKYLICYVFIILLFTVILMCNQNIKEYKTVDYTKSLIPKLNKIIVVGDSRMELIDDDFDELNLPNSSIVFDAKGGAKIDWFLDTGIVVLKDILDKRDTFKYNYHVVFNLGVNDLNSDEDPDILASNYYKIYRTVINKYNDVSFRFLSVNPIDEEILHTKRTNKGIEKFNKYFKNKVKKDKYSNIRYCDSYSVINFKLTDGIHYNFETNEQIMDFIINHCI